MRSKIYILKKLPHYKNNINHRYCYRFTILLGILMETLFECRHGYVIIKKKNCKKKKNVYKKKIIRIPCIGGTLLKIGRPMDLGCT